jgi:antitoxin (DNA-binding transcriptional repressor) of toxin-antitoxin stability system
MQAAPESFRSEPPTKLHRAGKTSYYHIFRRHLPSHTLLLSQPPIRARVNNVAASLLHSYNGHMRKVSISKLKNELSAILATIRSVGSITVCDRDQPVAVIYPPELSTLNDESGRAARLERAGIIGPARGRLDLKLLLSAAPTLLKKADAVKMLLEEREDGR